MTPLPPGFTSIAVFRHGVKPPPEATHRRRFAFFGTGNCEASVAIQVGTSFADATHKLMRFCLFYTYSSVVELAENQTVVDRAIVTEIDWSKYNVSILFEDEEKTR